MSAARSLSRHLKELRIHLCQTSGGSAGVREFINTNYKTLKSANPEFPILIRECSGIQVIIINQYISNIVCLKPRIIGRYEFGREEKIVVADFTPTEVDQAISSLADGPSTQ